MKKTIILTSIFLLLAFLSNAQSPFKKGYIVDNDNQKTECLIKYKDWRDCPKAIDYKLSEAAESTTATLETIKEFGVDDHVKFISVVVDVDMSSDNPAHLNKTMTPVYEKRHVFLEVLVEGKINLYKYSYKSFTKFFMKTESGEIKQLFYKRFREMNNDISEYYYFRKQLKSAMKCEVFSAEDFKELKYQHKALREVFVKYNTCIGETLTIFDRPVKDRFNLSARIGINLAGLDVENFSLKNRNHSFERTSAFRAGLELEYVLPYFNGNWRIILEPTYQGFKTTQGKTSINSVGEEEELKYDVNYQSIELPIGVRHYFKLNERSSIFANASLVYDIPFNSTLRTYRDDNSLNTILDVESSGIGFAFGAGYNWNKKFNMELRYLPAKELLNNYVYWSANFDYISVVVGYSFF